MCRGSSSFHNLSDMSFKFVSPAANDGSQMPTPNKIKAVVSPQQSSRVITKEQFVRVLVAADVAALKDWMVKTNTPVPR